MVVKLQGGLGNQLFQYAFGTTEAGKRGERVYFDILSLPEGHPPRRYGLGDYPIEVHFRTGERDEGEYLEGYWQAERWFDGPQAYRDFHLPLGQANRACRELARRIKVARSCFVGVRRSDYLWPERAAFHGVLPMSYYEEAMGRFPGDTEFFVFSDDPEWCREHFADAEVVDVNGEHEKHWDIWLMSQARNAIIANSSFHWWSAWLGADKLGGQVVAPKKWFAGQESEIVPQRWVSI